MALLLTTSTPDSLLNDLATLSVHHALVGHLLMTISRILIHLMPLCHLIAVTEGPLRSCLIRFLHRSSMLSPFRRSYLLHRCELTTSHSSLLHLHRFRHLSHHIASHIVDHFINIAKRILEKWVVCKWITHP